MVHAAEGSSSTHSLLLSREVASRSKEAVKHQSQHGAQAPRPDPAPEPSSTHRIDLHA